MKKAWIYCRIANPNSDAMHMQLEELRRYADERGYSVAGITQEYGNGLSLDRFGLMDVARAVTYGKASVVLAKDVSRIARNSGDAAQFVRFLQQHGASLQCVQDGEITNRIVFLHAYLAKRKASVLKSYKNTRNGLGERI